MIDIHKLIKNYEFVEIIIKIIMFTVTSTFSGLNPYECI